MRDTTLVKISLAWTLIGISILIYVALFTQVRIYKISELDTLLNQQVRVIGDVKSLDIREKVTIIELEDDSGSVKLAYFDTPSFNVSSKLDVLGIVNTYRDELEILVSQISCMSC